MRRRLAAIVALVVGAATIALAVAVTVTSSRAAWACWAVCWSPARPPGTACCGGVLRAWRG